MATALRLRRVGTKNLAVFRLVATDSRAPRDGRFIEILGHYDPRKKTGKEKLVINAERVAYWIGVGAVVSASVRNLLKQQGIALPVRRTRAAKAAAPAAAAPATTDAH